MSDPKEVLRLACEELDRLSDALDFMAEAHPHTGGRYVLIHLSQQAGTLADELRLLCHEPEPAQDEEFTYEEIAAWGAK